METIFTPKNAKKFYCESCNFVCSKQSDWSRHILTRKHLLEINGNNGNVKNAEKYECDICSKIFKTNSGLWKHRSKCSPHSETNMIQISNNNTSSMFEIDKELLIKMLLKNQDIMEGVLLKNQDVMEKMMEIMPKLGNNSHNITNNNTTNNQFNIQMFLNEHCKNAMNLTDFIDSLPITAATYDSTIQNGLTKTLTNMITNGLSQLDILERPIHCTDATRKTLYVKEANNWEKDTELLRILLGIRKLARKQRTMISEWKDVNEGWEKDDNIQTKLTTLICHSMTDIENDEKETSKIIRTISKNVYLDNETKQLYLN
jgi:hypothetical protein